MVHLSFTSRPCRSTPVMARILLLWTWTVGIVSIATVLATIDWIPAPEAILFLFMGWTMLSLGYASYMDDRYSKLAYELDSPVCATYLFGWRVLPLVVLALAMIYADKAARYVLAGVRWFLAFD